MHYTQRSFKLPYIPHAPLARDNQLAWIALLFPVVGLFLLIWAIRQTLNWRRFGTTLLQMDPFPGALGGDVGGAVELRLAYNPKYRFRVTLTCQHAYTRRTNDGNETVREAKWQDEQLAEVQPGMHGTRLRFLFQPPADLPESSAGDDSWYEWDVQISASLPGTDFERGWKVPVFTNAGPQTTRAPIERHRFEADSQGLLDTVVRIRATGAGLEIYYPYLRHPGLASGALVTGGGFLGFAWLFHAAAGDDGIAHLFTGLFTMFGILILLWGLYLLGNSLRITAGRQGLRAVRGLFGLQFARRVAAEEITAIEKAIGMQASRGNQARAYYRIEVHTGDGRSLTAGSGIPGASSVDAIIRRMRAALGLFDPESTAENTRHRPAEQLTVLPAGDVIAGQQRMKRIRLLIQAGAGVLFLAIVLWNFRDFIFRLW
jgi:hypothetical protein